MGAAGRDFHDFNVVFRDDPGVVVVAFTATQIPGIAGRRYPPELAGPRYPEGIPIVLEAELERLIREERVDEVVFAYSDVAHETVMHEASRVLAAGADFTLLGPESTMVAAEVPVISVCAVRTGAGKSQISRFVAGLLVRRGLRPVIVRHPMPYGDLVKQRVQRFATLDDLDRYETTVEEREDYEPHIRQGLVVYAGVDYEAIVAEAQREADVLVWDGGNNDFSFIRSDLEIVVVDPFRPGHELAYHPGETNLRRADVVVVNKVGSAPAENVAAGARDRPQSQPGCRGSAGQVGHQRGGGEDLRGRRVLVVEDGPTLTHGGMSTGAGVEAARLAGAGEIVDPRPWAVGSIADVYRAYPHLGPLLPAVGYFEEQLRDLEATIAATPVDVVMIATPFDITRVIRIDKPFVRVRYEVEELGEPSLTTVVTDFLSQLVERVRVGSPRAAVRASPDPGRAGWERAHPAGRSRHARPAEGPHRRVGGSHRPSGGCRYAAHHHARQRAHRGSTAASGGAGEGRGALDAAAHHGRRVAGQRRVPAAAGVVEPSAGRRHRPGGGDGGHARGRGRGGSQLRLPDEARGHVPRATGSRAAETGTRLVDGRGQRPRLAPPRALSGAATAYRKRGSSPGWRRAGW